MSDLEVRRIVISGMGTSQQEKIEKVKDKNKQIDLSGNGSSQEISVEEKAKRKKDLQHIQSQIVKDMIAQTPKSKAKNDKARMTEERKIKSDRDKKIAEVKAQFAQLEQNIQNLSEEEYNKYFKALFGKEPDEYRMKSEENPEFRPKFPKIDEIKTVNAALDNKNNYTEEQIEQMHDVLIQQREEENKNASQSLQDAKDKQGVFKKGCSWFVNHSQLFASTENSVLDAIGKDKKDIEELKQIAQSGDDIAFAKKYKEITGVDFSIENFEKMEEIQSKYYNAKNASDLIKATKDLNKPNTNYSLDYFEKDKLIDPKNPPQVSPLEKALFEYFGGKGNASQASENTLKWIQETSKELGVENADSKTKYEALQKSLLERTEAQKTANPRYNDVKSLRKEYEQSIKNAYGNNIAQEKLNNYISNVDTTYEIGKWTAITIAGIATGGGAGLAGLAAETAAITATDAAINVVEHSTDKDGYTKEDAKRDALEAVVLAGTTTAIGGAVRGFGAIKNAKAAEKAAQAQYKSAKEELTAKLTSSNDPELKALANKLQGNLSPEDISKLRRQVAMKLHPDHGGDGSLMADCNPLFDTMEKNLKTQPIFSGRTQSNSASNAQQAAEKNTQKLLSDTSLDSNSAESVTHTAATKEKAHFDKLYESVQQESGLAREELKGRLEKFKASKVSEASKAKEKAHFDKLYERVQQESELARTELKGRLEIAKKEALPTIKEELDTHLKALQGTERKFGIYEYEIEDFKDAINADNAEVAKKLVECLESVKNGDLELYYKDILKATTSENSEIAKKCLDIYKNYPEEWDRTLNVDGFSIMELLSAINKDNVEVAKLSLDIFKDGLTNGKSQFTCLSRIRGMMKAVNKDNSSIARELVSKSVKETSFPLDFSDSLCIENILKATNPENADTVTQLLKVQDEFGGHKYWNFHIEKALMEKDINGLKQMLQEAQAIKAQGVTTTAAETTIVPQAKIPPIQRVEVPVESNVEVPVVSNPETPVNLSVATDAEAPVIAENPIVQLADIPVTPEAEVPTVPKVIPPELGEIPSAAEEQFLLEFGGKAENITPAVVENEPKRMNKKKSFAIGLAAGTIAGTIAGAAAFIASNNDDKQDSESQVVDETDEAETSIPAEPEMELSDQVESVSETDVPVSTKVNVSVEPKEEVPIVPEAKTLVLPQVEVPAAETSVVPVMPKVSIPVAPEIKVAAKSPVLAKSTDSVEEKPVITIIRPNKPNGQDLTIKSKVQPKTQQNTNIDNNSLKSNMINNSGDFDFILYFITRFIEILLQNLRLFFGNILQGTMNFN